MSQIEPDLRSFLGRERDRLVDQLCEFIRIPAVAAEGGPDIAVMARRAADKCAEAGLAARIESTRGHPVVYACGGPDDAPFTLLTYGHYDVFPVADQPGWETDPFEPVIRGDRIYARGSGDNKGQFLAHLNAFQWWQREGGGLPIKVKVILEGEEENGSRHLPEFVERNRDELTADLCVYSDGPMLPGDRPALLFGARGALVVEFHSSGPARPLHSGNFGGVVANPILELARLLAEMIAPNGEVLVPGMAEGQPEATPAERAALAALRFDAAEFRERTGVDPLPELFGEPYYERLLYRASCNVSGITGGHTGPGARTLIPTSALAKADLRLVGEQDPDAVLAGIRRFAGERGFDSIEVRKLFSQPPSRTPLDHPYADLVERAVADGFGKPPARVPSLAGTTPDYVFTKMLGIPAIMLPFAPTDENHHGPNESMKISLFLDGVRASARLIEVIAEACRAEPLAKGARL
jgi:acetylornithine deacetylase/succinyl-diaminopimelate desuccinylase-like protein